MHAHAREHDPRIDGPSVQLRQDGADDIEGVIAENRRLMELARHNGFAIVTRTFPGNGTWWFVPFELQIIAGAMALLV